MMTLYEVTWLFIQQTSEPRHEKTCLISYVNNNGADQPAHSCSLISAFVFRNNYTCQIQNIKVLASLCSWSDRFESTWSQIPEDRFSCDVTVLNYEI